MTMGYVKFASILACALGLANSAHVVDSASTNEVQSLKAENSLLKASLDTLESRMTKMEDGMTKMENRTTKMEEERDAPVVIFDCTTGPTTNQNGIIGFNYCFGLEVMDLSGTFVAQYRGLYRFTFTTSVIYNFSTPGDNVRVNLKVDGETVAYLFERHLDDPCGGHHQASINTIQNFDIGQVVTVELETTYQRHAWVVRGRA